MIVILFQLLSQFIYGDPDIALAVGIEAGSLAVDVYGEGQFFYILSVFGYGILKQIEQQLSLPFAFPEQRMSQDLLKIVFSFHSRSLTYPDSFWKMFCNII